MISDEENFAHECPLEAEDFYCLEDLVHAILQWLKKDSHLTLQEITNFFIETNKFDHCENGRCEFHGEILDISGRFCARGTAFALGSFFCNFHFGIKI